MHAMCLSLCLYVFCAVNLYSKWCFLWWVCSNLAEFVSQMGEKYDFFFSLHTRGQMMCCVVCLFWFSRICMPNGEKKILFLYVWELNSAVDLLKFSWILLSVEKGENFSLVDVSYVNVCVCVYTHLLNGIALLHYVVDGVCHGWRFHCCFCWWSMGAMSMPLTTFYRRLCIGQLCGEPLLLQMCFCRMELGLKQLISMAIG